MLELSFLGPPEVRVAGRPTTFKTRKALALLAYLALEGGKQPREKLAGLLWPDADLDAGRASLRNTLAYLRDGLGPLADRLEADRTIVSLRLEPGELDALEVEAAAKAARAATPDPATLARAAGLYRGALLDGLELGEGSGFDAWLEERRAAVRAQGDLVFDKLSAAKLEGEPVAAAEAAARWVALDRLNEAAWRRLMLARIAAGQHSLGREAFEACRRTLREELGVEPAPETLALETRLVGTAERPRPAGRVPDLRALLLEGRLVGRAGEFSRLVEAYHRAARGRPGTVLVEGEPGIGKTRLASAFLDWARDQGAEVLRGRAFESSTGTPFGALADALQRRLRREARPETLLGRSWLSELSRLLPELRDRVPNLSPPTDDAGARQRLLQAVAEFGLALSNRSLLVVMIDDLQWADSSTLDALRYAVARFTEDGAPVLLVLTARSEGLAPGSSLATWATELGREAPLARLPLGGLSRDETRQLLGGLAENSDETTLAELVERLFEITGGQPLYLNETLKGLLERGALSLEGGRLRMDEGRLEGASEGVRAAIEARLSRLSPAALALAQAGAILGERAAYEVLRRTADLGEDDGLDGLEGLLRAGLLREAAGDAGGVRYLLSHDRVRETLWASLSSERRRVLHRRAASALEVVYEARSDEVALRVARHLDEAGEGERAAGYYRRAGERALRSAAPRESLELIERALALTPATRERQDTRVEMLERIGSTLALLDPGDLEAVERHWRSAADRARVSRLPSEESEALLMLSDVLSQKGRHEEAARLTAQVLAVARAGGDRRDVARALLGTGEGAAYQGDFEAARLDWEQALALARKTGDENAAATSLINLGLMARRRGNREAARPPLEEALTIRREQGRAEAVFPLLGHLAWLALADGEYSAAERYTGEGLEIASREENQLRIASANAFLGWVKELRGDNAAATQHLQVAVAVVRRYGSILYVANYLALLGIATAREGDRELAATMYEEARAANKANEDSYLAAATFLTLGDLAAELGNDTGAERDYRRALRAGSPDLHEHAIAGLAAVKARAGEWREAAVLVGVLFSRNAPLYVRERATVVLERLRKTTPAEELEEALERGRNTTLEAVVECWAL